MLLEWGEIFSREISQIYVNGAMVVDLLFYQFDQIDGRIAFGNPSVDGNLKTADRCFAFGDRRPGDKPSDKAISLKVPLSPNSHITLHGFFMSMEEYKKSKFDALVLADIVDLMLWTGQLLMRFGADSQRIERTVVRMGNGMGVDAIDIFISHNSLMITTTSEEGFRTKIRSVKKHAVNMTIISAISRLSWRVLNEHLDRKKVRTELERINSIHSHYPRWVVVGMVGLACAAFSKLFHGDWVVFGITFLAASFGMFVRQELAKRDYNMFLIVAIVSFCASLIAGTAAYFNLSPDPTIALAASVLLLVPGVPMINSIKDMVDNYTMVGLTRAIIGALISLNIAVGLILAMSLLGIHGL
jgi:uncharacterized membrane protein YjjP (DUF1212 family)